MKKLISTIPNANIIAEAEDGEEAVKKIHDFRPHLAILDIRMQKMNGIEVTELIKKKFDMKVFVVTNFYDNHSVASAKSAGADYVFDKSSDIDVMMKFVSLYAELVS